MAVFGQELGFVESSNEDDSALFTWQREWDEPWKFPQEFDREAMARVALVNFTTKFDTSPRGNTLEVAVGRYRREAGVHYYGCPTVGSASSSVGYFMPTKRISRFPKWVSMIVSGKTPGVFSSGKFYPTVIVSPKTQILDQHQILGTSDRYLYGSAQVNNWTLATYTSVHGESGGGDSSSYQAQYNSQSHTRFINNNPLGSSLKRGRDDRDVNDDDNNGSGSVSTKSIGRGADNRYICHHYAIALHSGQGKSHYCRKHKYADFVAQNGHVLNIHVKAYQCSTCYERFGTEKALIRHKEKCLGVDKVPNCIRPELLEFSKKVEACKDYRSLHNAMYRQDGTKLYDYQDRTDNLEGHPRLGALGEYDLALLLGHWLGLSVSTAESLTTFAEKLKERPSKEVEILAKKFRQSLSLSVAESFSRGFLDDGGADEQDSGYISLLESENSGVQNQARNKNIAVNNDFKESDNSWGNMEQPPPFSTDKGPGLG